MFWDPVFDQIGTLVGAPTDQLKLISAVLVSYPLGALSTRLPPSTPNLAHIFSIIVSSVFLGPLLQLWTGILHLLLACVGTYGLVVTQRGARMPWLVFVFVMGHLLINHMIRMISSIPVTAIEISTCQMVLAIKLTTFAWNVHDGRRKTEVCRTWGLADEKDLDDAQISTRLQQLPGVLPFLGYCFFFPCVLAGPSFDYATYDSLVKHTIYDISPPGTSDAQAKAAGRRIPHGRKRVAYLHLTLGLAFLGIYSVFGGRGSYERILTPEWYTWSLVTRFAFVQIAGFIARTKYYAVWSLAEGACILTGVGFNGYDPKTGRTLWNRVRNIDIVAIETAQSFKVLFDSWNCRTNIWLRDCIYKRLVKKGKKPGTMQSMPTFLTSAIWHGFDPGYYLAFVTAGLLTSVGRQMRQSVRPYFLPSTPQNSSPSSSLRSSSPTALKRAYDIAGWFLVQININYIASAFMLLSFRSCIQAWHRVGWYTHILVAIAMLFFQAGGRRALRIGILVQPKAAHKQAPSLKVSPPSPHDEKDSSDLRWITHALENPSHQDGGVAVHPDGGLVNGIIIEVETPRSESPKLKEL